MNQNEEQPKLYRVVGHINHSTDSVLGTVAWSYFERVTKKIDSQPLISQLPNK